MSLFYGYYDNVILNSLPDTLNNSSYHSFKNGFSYNRSQVNGYPNLISITTKKDFEIYFPSLLTDNDKGVIPGVYDFLIEINLVFSDLSKSNFNFSYFTDKTSFKNKIIDGQYPYNNGFFMKEKKIIKVKVPLGKEVTNIVLGIKESNNKINGNECSLNYIIKYKSSF